MSKLLVLLTICGWTNAIAPVWAESIKIRFTGVVEERVSVSVSEPQATSVEIAANDSENIQIPTPSYLRTLSINSTQPVSVKVTSNLQGQNNAESRETVVGKAEFKLPSSSKDPSSTASYELTITVVPH